ncbi:GUN4 domain-containing protein [Dolichospermum circinale]|uniref:GUN4 domain-containing protein n=1 Tax=Dolichospermum circinale TaxID=109265 RepID=UPI00232C6A20|nr:GUN4 domain-containing protein [Dolichospermum circinale]MDB9454396.1 GUN4 domain-containing protein [Dolichospermum circinale CS-541/06]MDB9462431.1 GUN4 domain-containing protein [Dolichospermum circinale CS-541/04]MDB9546862.1 GUN4 domain-containing protein [Dolichospermum circinale CS-1031]
MTVLTCASTGKSITLLKEIAHSGEAKIWRTNENGYLAKIYHSPTPERVQKLAVMIDHPPTEPNSHLHHVSFAWPKSALKNAQGDCVGFLMPEIKNGKELIDVYNPRRRQTLKLEIDWRFLHTTALNIVSIIEALHAAGYVLGDIKPQNILVNNRALPSIIDTDSFQVINPNNGKVYRCLVGSEGYTPPELMGKDFDRIEQTEVHDRFRLGVIIYQLLFGGNNPFQGKWTGAGETPEPDEIIRRGLWLYSPNSLIEPVARTIPMIIVHPAIRECFLKCFNDGHKNPNLRPTAREWLEALKVGNDRLTICGRVDSHYYSRTYGKCYWCDRSTNLGVDIFPGVVKAKPSVVVESTIFAATNTLELVKQEGKIITVVGKVVITRHLRSANIFFINFGNVSSLVNGYSPFTIVIFSEGLKNLSNSRSLTITQLSNWVGSYIKITGTLEVHQKSGRNTPQIILKDSNQISLISQAEANNLITGKTNINNSAAVKQTQSQVTQPAVYKPQNQPVITQPSGLYTNTTTSSPVKQTPSQISQTTHSTNLPNSSRRRFLQILGLTGFGFALVMTGERVLDREKPQPSPLPTSVEKVLKSPVIDYTELIVLLSAGKWKEADQETQRVMLSVTKLENEFGLNEENIENFSCIDLRTIDQLWVKFSNGKFGFSVQKRIYQNLGGTKEYNKKIWGAFADHIGWRKYLGWSEGDTWLRYDDMTFDNTAPEAHFPNDTWNRMIWGGDLTGGGGRKSGSRVIALMSRLIDCNIDNRE